MTINELYEIINDRKLNKPDGSYTASLFKKGKDRIIQKVGEEAVEVVIAAKNEDNKRIVSELADLLFHVLVLMNALDIKPKQIMLELDSRRKWLCMIIKKGILWLKK